MNAFNRAPLENSTYQRDGKWYTLAVIDSANAIERAATDDEIAAASVSLPSKTPPPVKVAEKAPAKPKAKPAKAKAKK